MEHFTQRQRLVKRPLRIVKFSIFGSIYPALKKKCRADLQVKGWVLASGYRCEERRNIPNMPISLPPYHCVPWNASHGI